MRTTYITMEREYGSAGTQIAKRLSEESGIPCYGVEILDEASKELNIPVEQLSQYEEKVTNSLLYSFYAMGQIVSGNSNMLSAETSIMLAEHNIIRGMADKGSAIFLGHCAYEALKDREGLINVFIHGDTEFKRARVAKDYGIPEEKVESTMRKFDRKRANYYHVNTGKQWRDISSYDVVLDSSKLGIETCVQILLGLMQ